MARLIVVLTALIGICAQAAWAQKESRVALVIGNGAYQNAEPLRNPVNDARAMARVLRDAGFEVILRENATRRSFVEALHEFAGKVTPGGVGLFYYAGHGMQVRGLNHLLPVDAVLATERDVKYETIDINDVLSGLDEARARLSLVILDACRDNPFARSFRSTSRGLAQTDAPRGTVIAYATAPGDTAADGDGENGVYTAELLKAIAEPGLKLEEVFKRTIDGVARATANKQTPWVSSSFRGDFVFNAAAAAPPPSPPLQPSPPVAAAPAPPAADAQTAWTTIAASNNPAMFELFLKRFPTGVYADFARARLEELKTAAALEERRRSAAGEARRKADADAARQAAEQEARRVAAAEEARRTAAADEAKKSVEAVEAALRLADIDRKRIQAALTARGFDTLGADGAFGPRTRQMITNWQRSRGEPPTGYLTATQAALLTQEGQGALAKIEDERRKAEAERARAAPPAPAPAPARPQQAAAPAAIAPGARDGSWRVSSSCVEAHFASFTVSGSSVSANIRLTVIGRLTEYSTTAISGAVQANGSFAMSHTHNRVTVTGTISATAIQATVVLPEHGTRCSLVGSR
ncbi:MAG: caspase family protein [Alphaproteobacteria bacterium]|nr:caspase family protein [Alphaproteobacteria bacterium]MCW5742518.1 caspase family protein [Alphaproteobacteria bacterium]